MTTINTTFTVYGREYRVLRELDGHIATVVIPHHRKPSAWLAIAVVLTPQGAQ